METLTYKTGTYLHIAFYQFTNSFRPVSEYKYDRGNYIGSNINGPAEKLAWHMYRNLAKLLPEGVTECSQDLWETLPNFYSKL